MLQYSAAPTLHCAMPIKVAIVEDDARIRESLAILINGSNEFRCIGTFPNAEAALRGFPQNWPDVALMDINLPKMSGIECVAKLKELRPALHIIMLTICADDEQIFNSLKAGASGYLIKQTSLPEILEAIADVHAGGAPMSNAIARKVIQYFRQSPGQRQPAPAAELTKREQEILSQLAKGFQYKEIAEALDISLETVRTHIRHTYEKLHVRSRTEAINKFFGRQSGL
jgi:DNA-binding NarL/FixJ family response regulator